jgi:hypothetical protein
MAQARGKTWVDFTELKERITFAQVLARLEVQAGLEQAGDELRGPCPICKRGDAKSKSFSINVGKQVFQCFACKRRGNVLDFTAAARDTDVHRAALWLRDQFLAAPAVAGEGAPAAAVQTAEGNVAVPADQAPDPDTPQAMAALTARERWLAHRIARGVARYLADAWAPLQDVETVAAGMLAHMETPDEESGATDETRADARP